MRGVEKIYNRYLNNTIDKVILAIILVYGFLVIVLSLLIIIENKTMLKSVIKTVSRNMSFYMPWIMSIMPVVRFSQIIKEKNVLEGIIGKSYKDKFIIMIKNYVAMYMLYLCVAIIHNVLIPIVNNDFKNEQDMFFVFGNYLSTICFSIGISMYCICGSIVRGLGKGKLILVIFISGTMFYMNNANFNLMSILTTGKGVDIYLGSTVINNTLAIFGAIVVYIILIFGFVKFILKNINKIDPKKTYWI